MLLAEVGNKEPVVAALGQVRPLDAPASHALKVILSVVSVTEARLNSPTGRPLDTEIEVLAFTEARTIEFGRAADALGSKTAAPALQEIKSAAGSRSGGLIEEVVKVDIRTGVPIDRENEPIRQNGAALAGGGRGVPARIEKGVSVIESEARVGIDSEVRAEIEGVVRAEPKREVQAGMSEVQVETGGV